MVLMKKYMDMSKEALIERILELERSSIPSRVNSAKRHKESKKIDFGQYIHRTIALKIAYLGFDYRGLVRQESTSETIEQYLLEALRKSTLVPDNIDTLSDANFSCCGRTDSGVSAFGQVVGIRVRSNQKHSTLNTTDISMDKELNYISMINAFLPRDIRVLNWASTLPDFNARFDCVSRTYKYHFIKGDLNIHAMNEACKHFIGIHNFKNFCKSTNDVETFERTIIDAYISPMDILESKFPWLSFYIFTIQGRGFLYHQVRCMMGMLFRIGNGEYSPDVSINLTIENDNS